VTRPSTAPAAQAASATTKPFADVRQQLIDRLIDEETDRKMAQIQDRIASMLASDWTAYHAAAATTMPATLPATSLGPPYNTVEYLQKLAMQIQSVYGVLPSVQSIADRFLTADDLARLPGIGQATREHPVQPLPMPLYIMTFTAPFVPEANRNHPDVLAEFEPTRVMHDAARNVYIARVSAAQVSHKPATLAEVEDQVRTDVIAKAAYDLARADASALLEKAKQSGLKSAAAGKSLLAIGPLTREPGASIPGLPISAASINMFLDKAFKLVTTPTSKPSGKPMELLELQHEGHVLVAELTDVQAMWNERTRSMEESQVADEVQRQFAQRFSQEWFNYNAVESRLKFVPAEGFSSREAPARPPEPAPPIF
jgi:hypothetical protein